MNPGTAIRLLRTLSIRLTLGLDVGSDQLIQAGLDALMAGVDAPSLAALAGLTRREEPDARRLFQDLVDELALTPTRPVPSGDPTADRWALVRWLAQLIVNRELHPATGGHLIWVRGWNELGHPDALQPIVSLTAAYEDFATSPTDATADHQATADTYTDRIIAEARKLLSMEHPT